MSDQATGATVRTTITVEAPAQHAFEVFTDGLGSWWDLKGKHIGAKEAQTATLEPRQGGRWFERAADGTECDWGRVLVWDPPQRLVLAWQISSAWAFDPQLLTEVDIRFIPEGTSRTRVELEHRGLEAFGDKAADMERAFASPDGWPAIMSDFAAAAAR